MFHLEHIILFKPEHYGQQNPNQYLFQYKGNKNNLFHTPLFQYLHVKFIRTLLHNYKLHYFGINADGKRKQKEKRSI